MGSASVSRPQMSETTPRVSCDRARRLRIGARWVRRRSVSEEGIPSELVGTYTMTLGQSEIPADAAPELSRPVGSRYRNVGSA